MLFQTLQARFSALVISVLLAVRLWGRILTFFRTREGIGTSILAGWWIIDIPDALVIVYWGFCHLWRFITVPEDCCRTAASSMTFQSYVGVCRVPVWVAYCQPGHITLMTHRGLSEYYIFFPPYFWLLAVRHFNLPVLWSCSFGASEGLHQRIILWH